MIELRKDLLYNENTSSTRLISTNNIKNQIYPKNRENNEGFLVIR